MRNTLICKKCGKEKEESEFSPHSGCKSGYDTSSCKACKRSAMDYSKVSMEKRIYHRAKSRATIKGIEFDLEFEDIVLPDVCPVFKKPFIRGDSDWTYSIDRINPDIGYTKDNIQIISNKANRSKNNLTNEEIKMLYEFVCEIP